MSAEIENGTRFLEKGKIYAKIDNGTIKYITKGMDRYSVINQTDIKKPIPDGFDALNKMKSDILHITSKRGHTALGSCYRSEEHTSELQSQR